MTPWAADGDSRGWPEIVEGVRGDETLGELEEGLIIAVFGAAQVEVFQK